MIARSTSTRNLYNEMNELDRNELLARLNIFDTDMFPVKGYKEITTDTINTSELSHCDFVKYRRNAEGEFGEDMGWRWNASEVMLSRIANFMGFENVAQNNLAIIVNSDGGMVSGSSSKRMHCSGKEIIQLSNLLGEKTRITEAGEELSEEGEDNIFHKRFLEMPLDRVVIFLNEMGASQVLIEKLMEEFLLKSYLLMTDTRAFTNLFVAVDPGEIENYDESEIKNAAHGGRSKLARPLENAEHGGFLDFEASDFFKGYDGGRQMKLTAEKKIADDNMRFLFENFPGIVASFAKKLESINTPEFEELFRDFGRVEGFFFSKEYTTEFNEILVTICGHMKNRATILNGQCHEFLQVRKDSANQINQNTNIELNK